MAVAENIFKVFKNTSLHSGFVLLLSQTIMYAQMQNFNSTISPFFPLLNLNPNQAILVTIQFILSTIFVESCFLLRF